MLKPFAAHAIHLLTLALALGAAGCSAIRSTPTVASAGRTAAAPAHRSVVAFNLIYSFAGSPDGAYPQGGQLVALNGILYGTTTAGGLNNTCPGSGGACGSIFDVTMTGGPNSYNLLYSFLGGTGDGTEPRAGLTNLSGTLYGTTSGGGSSDYGTFYHYVPGGNESLLYSFKGSPQNDGANPASRLLAKGSWLYGTTALGGKIGSRRFGTIFRVKASGREHVVYSFYGGNGEEPGAGVVAINSELYGTTSNGGANSGGTAYEISTSGTLGWLYSFVKPTSATTQPSGLVELNGTLYGETYFGGKTTSQCPYGCGTIFSVSPSGAYRLRYRFKGGTDGIYPNAGLVAMNGKLYGVTDSGGSYGCDEGCGTIFKVTTSGTESVLYRFSGGDSWNPEAALLPLDGTLYGTTYRGGANKYGTVFSLTP